MLHLIAGFNSLPKHFFRIDGGGWFRQPSAGPGFDSPHLHWGSLRGAPFARPGKPRLAFRSRDLSASTLFLSASGAFQEREKTPASSGGSR